VYISNDNGQLFTRYGYDTAPGAEGRVPDPVFTGYGHWDQQAKLSNIVQME